MSKVKKVLKSQTGQGVWEYMVILVGIGAVAFGISKALHGGLVGDGTSENSGTTGLVVDNVEGLINSATNISDEVTNP
jgi:hypothetical protein